MSYVKSLFNPGSALQSNSSESIHKENLMSRVRDHALSLRKLEQERQEDEKIVSKLISGQIERQPIQYVEDFEPHGINILPDDVIRKILGQLKDLKHLFSCELGEKGSSFQDHRKLMVYFSVCRRWNAIVRDIWFSKRKLVLESSFFNCEYSLSLTSASQEEELFSILRKCPNLRKLYIDPFLGSDITLFIIGNCCPKIERLYAKSARFEGASLESLAKYCPGLKSLHLPGCEFLDENNFEGFLKVAEGLEYLTLTDNWNITGECFNHFQKIKDLDLSGCKKLTDENFTKLAEKCSASLQQLAVREISMRRLAIICESFPNLHTLDIGCIEEGSGCPTLDRITSSQLEKLEHLRIYGLYAKITDREFFEMIKPARKLKKLFLPHCNWVTDEMLSTTLTVCKEIESLEVSSHKITDQSLISVTQLESLVELNLSFTKVTDGGIMKLLSECPKLTFLNVDDCYSVSIATLYSAYDLIRQGSLNKQLVICFEGYVVRMDTLKDREDISHYSVIDYGDFDYTDFYSSSD
ncbi:uncharacterized protein LOC141857447 [Brevipalpus obovatus]|uniref:uncharacterized protein LOC141857447 n=1 Tax=Brevipalpus obovatus TaxID=246614 RepID=UPI003D9DF2CE